MTATQSVADSKGRKFRIVSQKTQVTCGPASCLILWANVNDASPVADEGGVIALSKMFPKPWSPTNGAEINNLSRVLAQMGVRNGVQTFKDLGSLKLALGRRVKARKPAMAYVEWEETSGNIKGHFVVVAAADTSTDSYTILDPLFGLQEMGGLPYYSPPTGETDPPTLKFSGAVIFVE